MLVCCTANTLPWSKPATPTPGEKGCQILLPGNLTISKSPNVCFPLKALFQIKSVLQNERTGS